MICTQETNTKDRPEWTQKVVDAVVRAHIFASQNKGEVAKLLSRDGKGYLPTPSDAVVRAMTDYGPDYEKTGAIRIAGGTTAALISSHGPTRRRQS